MDLIPIKSNDGHIIYVSNKNKLFNYSVFKYINTKEELPFNFITIHTLFYNSFEELGLTYEMMIKESHICFPFDYEKYNKEWIKWFKKLIYTEDLYYYKYHINYIFENNHINDIIDKYPTLTSFIFEIKNYPIKNVNNKTFKNINENNYYKLIFCNNYLILDNKKNFEIIFSNDILLYHAIKNNNDENFIKNAYKYLNFKIFMFLYEIKPEYILNCLSCHGNEVLRLILDKYHLNRISQLCEKFENSEYIVKKILSASFTNKEKFNKKIFKSLLSIDKDYNNYVIPLIDQYINNNFIHYKLMNTLYEMDFLDDIKFKTKLVIKSLGDIKLTIDTIILIFKENEFEYLIQELLLNDNYVIYSQLLKIKNNKIPYDNKIADILIKHYYWDILDKIFISYQYNADIIYKLIRHSKYDIVNKYNICLYNNNTNKIQNYDFFIIHDDYFRNTCLNDMFGYLRLTNQAIYKIYKKLYKFNYRYLKLFLSKEKFCIKTDNILKIFLNTEIKRGGINKNDLHYTYNEPIIKLLKNKNSDFFDENYPYFANTAKIGYTDKLIFETYKKFNLDPNKKCESGKTALDYIYEYKKFHLLERFLNFGCDPKLSSQYQSFDIIIESLIESNKQY